MVDYSTNTPSSSERIIPHPSSETRHGFAYQDYRRVKYAPEYPAADIENPIRGMKHKEESK
jgi:hypothetical protein